MELTVYHKTDVAFFTIKESDFISEHMGESKITATVYFPTTQNFEVGAYVLYRGEKYSIFKKVTGTKTARTSEGVGDAMKYDLEFFSPAKILETINFEDYVSSDDTKQYYTGTPVFHFFNNVNELAIRLQANLDRFTGVGTWTVTVDGDVVLEEFLVSVSNLNLSQGLKLVQDIYGLDYYISGTSITIGGLGENIATTFFYGKDKGLYEITRIFESKENIITRLKTYGANRNLPQDYLRDADARGRYYTQLMLPNFANTGIDYVDAPADVITEYGIREGSKIFEDVYPSIEEVDLGDGRIDEIISVDSIDPDSDYFTIHTRDLGFEISEFWTAETAHISIKGTNADGDPTYLGGYEFEIVKEETSETTFKLLKNQSDNNILPDLVTTVRAGDRFVILGIEMPPQYIINAENKLALRAAQYFDEDGGIELSYVIKPDEKFIETNSLESVLKEGKRLKIEDDDLGVANYFTVQNLSIKYQDLLPKYDIKLSNIKAKTLKAELEKTKINQNNTNVFISSSNTQTRISNNLRIDQAGEDLTWEAL